MQDKLFYIACQASVKIMDMKLTKNDLGYLMISASVIMASYFYDWKLAIIIVLAVYGSRFMKPKEQ